MKTYAQYFESSNWAGRQVDRMKQLYLQQYNETTQRWFWAPEGIRSQLAAVLKFRGVGAYGAEQLSLFDDEEAER